MQVECIGTGSEGNAYIVKSGGRSFLLDAGVNIQKIIKHININDLDFAFISHDHKDHSREAENLRKKGVSLALGKSVQGFQEIETNRKNSSVWKVYAFPVKHGDTRCGGCIVKNLKTKETILYMTDFTLCIYSFAAFKFDVVLIEANYIQERINQVEMSDIRVLENIKRHCELGYTMKILDTLNTKEIILCHASKELGDPIEMASRVYNKYNKPTGICKRLGGIDWYGKDINNE